MYSGTQSLKERLKKLQEDKIDNPFTANQQASRLDSKLTLTAGILPTQKRIIDSEHAGYQTKSTELEEQTIARPVEPPIISAIPTTRTFEAIENKPETTVEQISNKRKQPDYDQQIKQRMEAATELKIKTSPILKTANTTTKTQLENKRENQIKINFSNQNIQTPTIADNNPIQTSKEILPSVNIAKANEEKIKPQTVNSSDLIEKSLKENGNIEQQKPTDNSKKVQIRDYPIEEILSGTQNNTKQLTSQKTTDLKTTRVSVPVPPYTQSKETSIKSDQPENKLVTRDTIEEITIQPPDEKKDTQIDSTQVILKTTSDLTNKEEQEATKTRRLYLVNRTAKEQPLTSEKPWSDESIDQQNPSSLKEIRVKAVPEIAEQEGFDQMVNEVYTQLKASSVKSTNQIMNMPPSSNVKKEMEENSNATADSLVSKSLFSTDNNQANNQNADSKQLPITPQTNENRSKNTASDLFVQLSKVNEHLSTNNKKHSTEQVKFVEIPREKGMGCPNCRETSTRVVFCPYCGSGMCANCSPNIRPEEDYFIYTCPRCGEEINVSKK